MRIHTRHVLTSSSQKVRNEISQEEVASTKTNNSKDALACTMKIEGHGKK